MKYYEEQVTLDTAVPARIYIQKGENNNYYPLHWHNSLEFDLIIQGTIFCKVGSRAVTVSGGDIFFANSGELHETNAAPNTKIESVTLLLSKKLIKEYCRDIDKYYFDFSDNPSAKKEIHDIILKCADVFEQKNELYTLELDILLRRLCLVLLRRCKKMRSGISLGTVSQASLKNVKKAIAFMEENYDREITLAEISAEIGMAPTYFSRFFKRSTGENFYVYLNSIRLYHAENDLLNTELSVTEIAFNNGFANVKSFIETFKRRFDATPSKYRKLHG